MCWPPAPLARKVSTCARRRVDVDLDGSSISGVDKQAGKEVVAPARGCRTAFCAPGGARWPVRSRPKAYSPRVDLLALLMPATSPGFFDRGLEAFAPRRTSGTGGSSMLAQSQPLVPPRRPDVDVAVERVGPRAEHAAIPSSISGGNCAVSASMVSSPASSSSRSSSQRARVVCQLGRLILNVSTTASRDFSFAQFLGFRVIPAGGVFQ